MANKLRIKNGNTVIIDDLSLDSAYTKTLLTTNKFLGNNIIFESYDAGGSTYDYGDGSLNLTTGGYNNKLYVNGTLYTPPTDSYYYGNYYNACYGAFISTETLTPLYYISDPLSRSGTTTITYSNTLDSSKEYTISNSVVWGYGSGTKSFNTFKIIIDGTQYTPQQAVANSLIKPLVIMHCSGWTTSYICSNVLNMYNGGTYNGTYAFATITYMTNTGHSFTGYVMSGDSLSGGHDGCLYQIYNIADLRLTLNSY